MAAYAALVSLINTTDQIKLHPSPPVSLDQTLVESLSKNVTFLQEFLEGYSQHIGYNKEADPLERRIADAAHAIEDVIESHIKDQIIAASRGENISCVEFYEDLQRVIGEMEYIKQEAMEIKEKMEFEDKQPRRSSLLVRSSSTGRNMTMVGFDDVFIEIMDMLAGGERYRQIIPIVGMGGIGKTTLARNIYAKRFIREHFDICAWATISREYDTREILRELCEENKEAEYSKVSENELGEELYRRLSGRRYLIVLDDMWNIDVWYKIKLYFPDYNNGSRVVVTTRLKDCAIRVSTLIKFWLQKDS